MSKRNKQVEDLIIEALVSAYPHVYRQQHHGKHEQDRIDAKEWLATYSEVVRTLSGLVPNEGNF